MGSLITRLFRGALSPFNADVYVPHFEAACVPQTGEIRGFETLARKQLPGLSSLLHPGQFLNSIVSHDRPAFDFIMLHGACDFRRKLELAYGDNSNAAPFVSVNLTPETLSMPELPALVAEALEDNNVSPSGIKLEIVEAPFQEGQLEQIKTNVAALHGAGHKIVLDDFMCDASDFSRLEALRPWISGVKLSPAFQKMPAAFQAFVIDQLHEMGLEITMENVEEEHQYNLTIRARSDLAQGYRYHKPVSASEAIKLALHSSGLGTRHGFDERAPVGQTQVHGLA